MAAQDEASVQTSAIPARIAVADSREGPVPPDRLTSNDNGSGQDQSSLERFLRHLRDALAVPHT